MDVAISAKFSFTVQFLSALVAGSGLVRGFDGDLGREFCEITVMDYLKIGF